MSPPRQDQKYEASMEDYLEAVSRIWSRNDKRHPHMTLLYVVAHASEVCEAIRKRKWDEAAKELAEVVMWWFSLIDALSRTPSRIEDAYRTAPHVVVEPSDIIWSKFPGGCTVCLGRHLGFAEITEAPTEEQQRMLRLQGGKYLESDHTCICAGYKTAGEQRTGDFKRYTKEYGAHLARERLTYRPKSMHGTTEMLKRIFHNNVHTFTVEEIAFHLLEEVGEVTDAFLKLFIQVRDDGDEAFIEQRIERIGDLVEEIADVFAWCVMLHSKLELEMKNAIGIVKLTEKAKDVEGLSKVFETAMKPMASLVDLVWAIYGKKGFLHCETCEQDPCVPEGHRKTNTDVEIKLDESMAGLLMQGSENFRLQFLNRVPT